MKQNGHMGKSTEIEKFKIKKIPFNPSGTETNEYPFVRSDDFDVIVKAANDCKDEKKTDLFIVKAPQGGGKTATIDTIAADFSNQKDTIVFPTSLKNLESEDLINQVVAIGKSKGLISDEFLQKLNYDTIKDMQLSAREDFLIKIFEEIMKKHELGVWIVDEFDVISSIGTVGENAISQFLQWFRGVYDRILKSEEIKSKKGFLIIMSHTEQSSKQFKVLLDKLHAPLASRIWNLIDIGYRLDETEKIVEARLKSVRAGSVQDDLHPFTKNSLKEAYDLTNSYSGSKELINFRILERVLYLAIHHTKDDDNVSLIDEKIINDSFQKAIEGETGVQDSKKISANTKFSFTQIIKNEMRVRNSNIFEGIKIGITDWLHGFSVPDQPEITYWKTENGLVYNKMKIIIKNDQNRAKKEGRFQLLFILVAKEEKKPFDAPTDFLEIQKHLDSIAQERRASHLTYLILVPGIDFIHNIDEIKKSVTIPDLIIQVTEETKRDLIYLSCCQENERKEFEGTFGSEIRPQLENGLNVLAKDIHAPIEDKILNLWQIIAFKSVLLKSQVSTGQPIPTPQKQDLKDLFADYYNTGSPTDQVFKKLIANGFASDTTNGIVFKVPRLLDSLLISLNTQIPIEEFKKQSDNSTFVIDVASNTKLLDQNEQLSTPDSQILDSLIKESDSVLKDFQENPISPPPRNYEKLEELKIACENLEKLDEQQKTILIPFLEEKIRETLDNISKGSFQPPPPPPPDKCKACGKLLSEHTSEELAKCKKQLIVQPPPPPPPPPAPPSEEKLLKDIEEVLTEPVTIIELQNKLIVNKGYSPNVLQDIFNLIRKSKLKLTF